MLYMPTQATLESLPDYGGACRPSDDAPANVSLEGPPSPERGLWLAVVAMAFDDLFGRVGETRGAGNSPGTAHVARLEAEWFLMATGGP